jgi:hypothetical protein
VARAQLCRPHGVDRLFGPSSQRYFTSVSILNIGMYIAMMITPTMQPTPIIMIGSMMDVSDATDASTSSS